MLRHAYVIVVLCLSAASCGLEPMPSPKQEGVNGGEMGILDRTPGYFRDMARLIEAQAELSDAEAAQRLRTEISLRVTHVGGLPAMVSGDEQTLYGLLILASRAVHATSAQPRVARAIAIAMLHLSLGLDPAVDAMDQDASVAGNAATIASAACTALEIALADYPSSCGQPPLTGGGAEFVPGSAEVQWVEGSCQPDRIVKGYCEPDLWIEGQCYDRWISSDCSSSRRRDIGYWQYVCYSSTSCKYVWRRRYIYDQGSCSGGYYESYCTNGYTEIGLCYDDTVVAGVCTSGHYEYSYPNGVWSFAAAQASPPSECTDVRPSQYAIAMGAVEVLRTSGFEAINNPWRTAIVALLKSPRRQTPDDALYDAMMQIINAVSVKGKI